MLGHDDFLAWTSRWRRHPAPDLRPVVKLAHAMSLEAARRRDPVRKTLVRLRARDLWDSAAARGLIPLAWVGDPGRRFRRAETSERRGRAPRTVWDVLALASDVQGVLRAEALVRELFARLKPWAMPGTWLHEGGPDVRECYWRVPRLRRVATRDEPCAQKVRPLRLGTIPGWGAERPFDELAAAARAGRDRSSYLWKSLSHLLAHVAGAVFAFWRNATGARWTSRFTMPLRQELPRREALMRDEYFEAARACELGVERDLPFITGETTGDVPAAWRAAGFRAASNPFAPLVELGLTGYSLREPESPRREPVFQLVTPALLPADVIAHERDARVWVAGWQRP